MLQFIKQAIIIMFLFHIVSAVSEAVSSLFRIRLQRRQQSPRSNNSIPNIQMTAEMNRLKKENAELNSLKKENAELNSLKKENAELNSLKKENAELNSLKKENAELNSLKKENAELNSLKKENAELNSLQKENAELNRLKKENAELNRLKKENVELNRLKKENAYNRQQTNVPQTKEDRSQVEVEGSMYPPVAPTYIDGRNYITNQSSDIYRRSGVYSGNIGEPEYNEKYLIKLWIASWAAIIDDHVQPRNAVGASHMKTAANPYPWNFGVTPMVNPFNQGPVVVFPREQITPFPAVAPGNMFVVPAMATCMFLGHLGVNVWDDSMPNIQEMTDENNHLKKENAELKRLKEDEAEKRRLKDKISEMEKVNWVSKLECQEKEIAELQGVKRETEKLSFLEKEIANKDAIIKILKDKINQFSHLLRKIEEKIKRDYPISEESHSGLSPQQCYCGKNDHSEDKSSSTTPSI